MWSQARAVLIAALLFAAASAGAEPSVDAAPPWQAFAPEAGHFEVLLPGEPVESQESQLTPVGRIRGKTYWVDQGRRAFGVELRELPTLAIKLLSPSTIFDEVKESMLAEDGGRELEYQAITLNGVSGREIVYETHGGSILERARLMLIGRRLYIVAAARPEDAPDGPVERFFRSFKVWK